MAGHPTRPPRRESIGQSNVACGTLEAARLSPTVLRVAGYRFHFFSNEQDEPPHIHVTAAGKTAKFWLRPVRLAKNFGYPAHELHSLWDLVLEHRDELERAWREYFSS